jgi:uncharacterized membrane protein YoaK (UPF0700 family)
MPGLCPGVVGLKASTSPSNLLWYIWLDFATPIFVMFVGVLIVVLVESMFGGSMLCLKVLPSVVVSSSS